MEIPNVLLIKSFADLEKLTEDYEDLIQAEEDYLQDLRDEKTLMLGDSSLSRAEMNSIRSNVKGSSYKLAGFLIQWITRSLNNGEIKDPLVSTYLFAQKETLVTMLIKANKNLNQQRGDEE